MDDAKDLDRLFCQCEAHEISSVRGDPYTGCDLLPQSEAQGSGRHFLDDRPFDLSYEARRSASAIQSDVVTDCGKVLSCRT